MGLPYVACVGVPERQAGNCRNLLLLSTPAYCAEAEVEAGLSHYKYRT